MARIRTIPKAVEEIKRTDPDSCINESYIRKLIYEDLIHFTRSGRRFYINVDEVEAYAKGGNAM